MLSESYFVSWSGGKDSYLALHKAAQKYGLPRVLLTMMIENGQRSRSHGLKSSVLEAQSRALGVTLSLHATSWNDYEINFLQGLNKLREHNITWGCFGDIKIADDAEWATHRSWADNICRRAHIKAYEPLWGEPAETLICDFLSADINAIIVSVKEGLLDKQLLGQRLTADLFDRFKDCNVHPLGERGEYHTLVVDAPFFSHALPIQQNAAIYRDGYWFLDVDII